MAGVPMADAIREWQRGVFAIGIRSGVASANLAGTGFIVDLPSGLIVTCAHVVLDAFKAYKSSPAIFADPCSDRGHRGLAIGVGGISEGETIEWRCVAELRYISPPPSDWEAKMWPQQKYGPLPPAHWPVPEDNLRLDLAILQLVELDGSPWQGGRQAAGLAGQ